MKLYIHQFMGTIYLITCNINGMHYIGQTCNDVQIRWNSHKKCAEKVRKYNLGEIDDCAQKTSYLYNAMFKHGIDNFTFTVICDNVADDELDSLEISLIKEYNSLKPNGFNLASGGGHFRHHEDTKKLMSELAIVEAVKHLDKYRREETKGLPMYIVAHNKGNARGFAVCGHPLCSYKSFTLSKHGSMDECKEAALEFLNELTTTNVKHEFKKAKPDLPVGITVFRTGYVAKRKINGVMHKRVFEGKNIPDETKLQNAKDYLESLPAN